MGEKTKTWQEIPANARVAKNVNFGKWAVEWKAGFAVRVTNEGVNEAINKNDLPYGDM